MEMTSYRPGTVCWADLGTTDPEAAKRFYAHVFGWNTTDSPMGDGSMYTMLSVGQKNVAALSAQQPDDVARQIPPHWNVYVAVEDVVASANGATALGGEVLAQPFDVMDAGRMAVIKDPSGGVLSLWQPGKNPGAALYGEKGAICWIELMTRDVLKATRFYKSLFQWHTKDSPEYVEFHLDAQAIGGCMETPKDMANLPPSWGVYFQTDDCDATTARALEMGGTTIVAPHTAPGIGRFAIIRDPQGAVFSTIQLLR